MAVGVGVGISPRAPWLPYETTISDEWTQHNERGKQPSSEDDSSRSVAAPEQFEGTLRADPDQCYKTEKEGDCAARIVQQGISSFYFWLTMAAASSAIAAIFTAVAVFKQVRVSDEQAAILKQQTNIMQVQADLEPPRLFCVIREQNFDEVFSGFAGLHYTTVETVTVRNLPKVTFSLRNYGRSPAILLYVNAKVDRRQTTPDEHTAYDVNDLPRERVLGRDQTSGEMATSVQHFESKIKRSEYNMLQRGQTYWWFFGYVGFVDVWGNRNRYHFCWRYDQSLRVFDPHPPERNYTERLPKPEDRA